MTIRVGINGFGRIGRNIFRASMRTPEVEIVAVNDLTDAETLAHLLKYDSVHGIFDKEIKASEGKFYVDGREIKVLSEKDPASLSWGELNVDIVVESTGIFTRGEDAAKHLQAGAKKVLISAPGKQVDATIVMGVNQGDYDPNNHHVVSNASCTTNCLAPVAKILHDNFGIEKGLMTTVHSYTNDQQILDLPHKDLRRARAANLSMIPTTTGAAKAVAQVIPELEGRLNGHAVRIPTPNVSLVDFTAVVQKNTSTEEVNKVLEKASQNELRGIMTCSDAPLVSCDYNGDPHSAVVDGLSTMVLEDNLVKIFAWYDNEWGYSCRVLDLAIYMSKRESGPVDRITWTGIEEEKLYQNV